MENEIAQRVASVLKAISHPTRLKIIESLQHEAKCVSQLIGEIGEKQSITSQHLNHMRDKNILAARKDGAKVFYSIANPNVIKVLHCIYSNCQNKQEPGK